MEAVRQLTEQIMEELGAGTVELPSLPDVVWRVRAAVADENVSVNKLAVILQVEPSITARIIQIANSAAFVHHKPVDSCHAAISRLGLDTVRDLVTCLAMNSVFADERAPLRRQIKDLWAHSRHIAAIAGVLGGVTPRISPEKAMLAGLTHDIGELILLRYAGNYAELVAQPALLTHCLASLRGMLGSMVLHRWNFDPEIAAVPEHAEDWLRDTGDAIDYCDIVIVAQMHALFGNPQRPDDLPAMTDMPAFRKLPVSKLGADGSLEILNQARDEIRYAARALGGHQVQ